MKPGRTIVILVIILLLLAVGIWQLHHQAGPGPEGAGENPWAGGSGTDRAHQGRGH